MSDKERITRGDPECPHCGATYSDSWETFDIANDGQRERLECGGCDREFDVRQSVSVLFTSDVVGAL